MKDFLGQICRRCHNGADHSEPAPMLSRTLSLVVFSALLAGLRPGFRTPYVVKSEKLLIVE
jgi:hypothetical protein